MNNNSFLKSKPLELALYIAAQFFAYYISLKLDLFAGYDVRNYEAFYNTIPVLLLISSILILATGLLRAVNKTWLENILIITLNVSVINVIYMAIAFLGRDFAMPRTVIFLGAAVQFILFIIIKFAFIQLIKHTKKERRIILICKEQQKQNLIIKILSSHIYKEKLTHCVDPLLIPNYIDYMDKADKIYIADDLPSEIKDKVVSHCISLDKSLYMVPKTFEIAIFNSRLIQVSDVPVFKVESLYLSSEQLIVKRLFDIVLSAFGILIASPVMLIVTAILLVTQGRPVLYTQTRVTRNNKQFKLYKFRSMAVDAEKETGPIWAADNDPRITNVGRFLRRYWIDELPQLFNVIKGDMSMVGPRPERPIFIEEFSKDIPDFKYRLSVKAGVTGLAQVLGRYATSPEIKIKYDLIYIKNANLLYDIKIVLETIKKIIVGTLRRGIMTEYDYQTILALNNYREKIKNGVTKYSRHYE